MRYPGRRQRAGGAGLQGRGCAPESHGNLAEFNEESLPARRLHGVQPFACRPLYLVWECAALNEDAQIRLVEAPSEPAALADIRDDDLMALAKTGRQQAFEVLVKRYQSFVCALATRYLGNRATGGDVAQDVFLALWAERGRYTPRGKFRSYLVSVTLHRCHTVARKTKTQEAHARLERPEEHIDASEPDLPLQKLVERENSREVRKALTRIPHKHRQVLILRFTQDLSLEEISDATGFPLGTVKSHLFRGLKRLARLLDEEPSS